jgi:hypothetical protein
MALLPVMLSREDALNGTGRDVVKGVLKGEVTFRARPWDCRRHNYSFT